MRTKSEGVQREENIIEALFALFFSFKLFAKNKPI